MTVKKIYIGDHCITIEEKDIEIVKAFSTNSIHIIHNGNGKRYAAIKKVVDGKATVVMVAKLITKAPKGKCIIYKDKDTLNLLRSNLIVASKSNAVKSKSKSKRVERTSKYIGVSFAKNANKWHTQIKPSKHKPNMHIGYYATEDEAAIAYNDAAKKYHGKFAEINIINK